MNATPEEKRSQIEAELAQIEQAIALLTSLPDDQVMSASLSPLLDKQAQLQAELADMTPGGAAAPTVLTPSGKTITKSEAEQDDLSTLNQASVLGRYLTHVIGQNRYLQLQGIRSGGRTVHIELEQIYITLRARQQRTVIEDQTWLAEQSALAPGERHRLREQHTHLETVTVSVNEALATHRRLVVLGDPGSGKTTLLRYLALLYARDLHRHDASVQQTLQIDEAGHLPIFIPLRQVGSFLNTYYPKDDGVEGHTRLLAFLQQFLQNEKIAAPERKQETRDPAALVQLRQMLDASFNDEELRTLCFDCDVDYDNLPGRNKEGKIRELINQMRRHGRLPHLLQTLATSRPGLALPTLPDAVLHELPADFFDSFLRQGKAIILLDGLDEVASTELRRRIARLVEAFTRAYPDCRYLVTSRIVGYTGTARLGEAYTTTTVRDFTLADVEQFLTYWHRLVGLGQLGTKAQAERYAVSQTRQLMQAIRNNDRIWELAINPLMLTVLALVHRDRVKLPDRRAELYAEAVDVLLGKWDEARGVTGPAILDDKPFDTGDKRLLLQSVALHMHEQGLKEIDLADLRQLLSEMFAGMVVGNRAAEKAVDRFLQVIKERTGLLVERGDAVFAFSHLTFQEYLAALAIAGRDDYVAYTLAQADDSRWREVILLEVGHLSMQSKERTTRLIRAIADRPQEPEPYHNLVLAAECLRDVGSNRVLGNLDATIQQRLRADIELDIVAEIERRRPQSGLQRLWRNLQGQTFEEKNIIQEVIARKAIATEALVRSGAGYWTLPYGEPEWVTIPGGKFTSGGEGGFSPKKHHEPTFRIARVPVTNAQYLLFVQATEHQPPRHWEDGRPPKGKESHPVVYVSWHDAAAYCQWLSEVTGKAIRLPTETEWEKAARGDKDERPYPWGKGFDRMRCNTYELGLGDTTPVGIFPNGASPDGVLDMSGNVWEWTDSWYNQEQSGRVLRGGSWNRNHWDARVSDRFHLNPLNSSNNIGFRVVAPVVSGS